MLTMRVVLALLGALLLYGGEVRAEAEPGPIFWVPPPPTAAPGAAVTTEAAAAAPEAGEGDSFKAGLRAFQQRRFRDAAPLLERARRAGDTPDLLLLLGISYYRIGELRRAEPLLRRVAATEDGELSASARLFLALVLEEQGGADSARAELARLDGALGPSARGILQGLAPRRLQASFVLSSEYDGNVALTDLATWSADRNAHGDGDLLAIASLSARPLRSVGLALGGSLSYRQQLQPKFQSYNLLLGSAWASYSYLTEAHRLRAGASFGYALLGGSSLFVEGEWRASHRARLYSELGLLTAYVGRARAYLQADYAPFTGSTHTGQLELAWGLSPSPVAAGLGYQVVREELAPGTSSDDYRATAHGPTVRVVGKPHERLELLFTGSLLLRRFDAFLAGAAPRQDAFLVGDLSATVQVTRWLDGFVGLTLIHNDSNDAAFSYVKPIFYLGASARLSAL